MRPASTLYLIVRTYPMLEGKPTTITETDYAPFPATVEETATLVDEDTVKVLAINETAGTCLDVTGAIAEIVVKQADRRGYITPEMRDWCEKHGATVWHTISVEAA